MIAFVDIEASSLENGYPIEIGWARSDGRVGAALIRPHNDWKSLLWSAEAERVHRIPIDKLDSGVAREDALEKVCAELVGYQCFSDAPDYDWQWLSMLSPGRPQSLKLGKLPADSLLISIGEQSEVPTPIAARIIQFVKRKATHAAAADAAALAAVYEILARGGELRMRDVEATLKRWQALAAAAAPWRKG